MQCSCTSTLKCIFLHERFRGSHEGIPAFTQPPEEKFALLCKLANHLSAAGSGSNFVAPAPYKIQPCKNKKPNAADDVDYTNCIPERERGLFVLLFCPKWASFKFPSGNTKCMCSSQHTSCLLCPRVVHRYSFAKDRSVLRLLTN